MGLRSKNEKEGVAAMSPNFGRWSVAKVVTCNRLDDDEEKDLGYIYIYIGYVCIYLGCVRDIKIKI